MSELHSSTIYKTGLKKRKFKEKKIRSIEQQGKKYDDPRVARKFELRFMLYGKDKKKTKKKLKAARKKLHAVKAEQHEIRKQRRAAKRLARNKVKHERNEKYVRKKKALTIFDYIEIGRKFIFDVDGENPSEESLYKCTNTDIHTSLAKPTSSDLNKPEQKFIACVSTSDFLSYMFNKQLNLTNYSTFPTTANHSTIPNQPVTADDPTILSQPVTADDPTILSQPTTANDPTIVSQPTTANDSTILSQPTTVDHFTISSQPTISDTPAVSKHLTILNETNLLNAKIAQLQIDSSVL